ncbi:MAG TPA: HDIG domain-containing metalloprotein [Planktothrix sp.]
MPTDKKDPSDAKGSSQAVSNGDKATESLIRSRAQDTITLEHHYEPEAHHEWFPSEQFFFSWLAVGACGFIALCIALTAHHIFNPGFHEGDRAEKDIKATHASMVEDEVATKAARDEARQSVLPVFTADRKKDSSTINRIKEKLAQIYELQKLGITPIADLTPNEHKELIHASDPDFAVLQKLGPGGNLPTNLEKLRDKLGKNPHGKSILDAVSKQRAAWKAYLDLHKDTLDQQVVIAVAVSPGDLPKYVAAMEDSSTRLCRVFYRLPLDNAAWIDTAVEFMPDAWPQELRRDSASMACSVMEPNIKVDRTATEQKVALAAAAVKPVMKQINMGDVIVRKRDIITGRDIRVMEAMGITDVNRWPMIIGLCISLAAAVCLIALFLYTYDTKLLFSTRTLALMYAIAVITVALAALFGKTYPQMIPLPAAALVLTIFFGQRAAIAIALPLGIFLAVDRLIDFNNLVALGTAAGAAIGTYSKRRQALMSTGLVIGMAQAFGFLVALAVSQTPFGENALGSQLGLEFLGGIVSSIVAIGTLPFLENIFGLVTPFRLAELSDADQPLLRRLEEYAPGTYQHSLAVANLAEAGARSIGGDVNLVRAGAFYHDIGKMVRPKFFIENQLGATNPHDSMTPEQSRERVLAHVTDGLALAKQYSLPKAVQDFIPMHQGTTLMAYFYHKACVRDGVDKVDAMFYRYPGPKPQSKETSIVMLADVSEAVTHSMKNPTEEEVETAIDKVFQNRWDDGQFGESSLTFNELQRVKKAFVRVWRTLHHDRLKYPSTTTGRMPVPPEDLPMSPAPTAAEVVEQHKHEEEEEGGCCGTVLTPEMEEESKKLKELRTDNGSNGTGSASSESAERQSTP